MHVLVVYAHFNRDSFTHAVLEQVLKGLDDSPHTYTVDDLYASGFNPVFTAEDAVQFLHESLPEELLEEANPREVVLGAARGPLRRHLARRWLRGKDNREIARALAEHLPTDVKAQQALVAEADALIFVAPVYWMGFPAILKGWFERVFAYGFAYTLNRAGWQGDLEGRIPMLSQEKALIITPTFFTEEEYDKGWRQAMDTVICDWGLKMAGVKDARHVYLHAVVAAGDERRREYLDEAYLLARDF
ncbi:MAG TPA: NAD(P)H-dependent oxidoreductase [Solirubrobacteraceae bacterium]|nr:NAD(P)H-dependent oxidoreductase [Solirubrobacteraceae bacterium]